MAMYELNCTALVSATFVAVEFVTSALRELLVRTWLMLFNNVSTNLSSHHVTPAGSVVI